jgi:hypothetical protein
LFIPVAAKMGGSTYLEDAVDFLNTNIGFIVFKNKHQGSQLDNKVILLKLNTIHFAHIKAQDLNAVSNDNMYMV